MAQRALTQDQSTLTVTHHIPSSELPELDLDHPVCAYFRANVEKPCYDDGQVYRKVLSIRGELFPVSDPENDPDVIEAWGPNRGEGLKGAVIVRGNREGVRHYYGLPYKGSNIYLL